MIKTLKKIFIKKFNWWEYKKDEEIKSISFSRCNYITLKRHKEEYSEIENFIIIPIENINYIYIGDIYDDEYHKYKTRKTIVLKDGTKHKIYDKDEVFLSEKADMEKLLKK